MLALIALALAAAAPQSGAPAQADSPPPDLAKLMSTCSAHKFETTIDVTSGGAPHKSKVKLCGEPGQTDAQWIGTLKDAIAKVEGNDQMAAPEKDQIVSAIHAEIARLTSIGGASDQPMPVVAAPQAQIVAAPPPVVTTPPPQATPPARVATVAPPPPARPAVTIGCVDPLEIGSAGECGRIERGMQLTVRADADVSTGVAVRFLRRGDARGEITLPAMQTGEILKFNLPRELCAGVAASKVEIQLLSRGAVVDSMGPYYLRCN